jgi:hypothetical protein
VVVFYGGSYGPPSLVFAWVLEGRAGGQPLTRHSEMSRFCVERLSCESRQRSGSSLDCSTCSLPLQNRCKAVTSPRVRVSCNQHHHHRARWYSYRSGMRSSLDGFTCSLPLRCRYVGAGSGQSPSSPPPGSMLVDRSRLRATMTFFWSRPTSESDRSLSLRMDLTVPLLNQPLYNDCGNSVLHPCKGATPTHLPDAVGHGVGEGEPSHLRQVLQAAVLHRRDLRAVQSASA